MPARNCQKWQQDHYKDANLLLVSRKTQSPCPGTLGVLTNCCPQLLFVHAQLVKGQPLSTGAAGAASTHDQPTSLPSRRQKAWHHWLLLLLLLLLNTGASCCVIGCVRLLHGTKGVNGRCGGESFQPAGLPGAEERAT
jgi:hypothetical protein